MRDNNLSLNRDIQAVSLAVSNLFRNLHNSNDCSNEAYTNVQEAMIAMRRAMPAIKHGLNEGKHTGFKDHVAMTEA